jgi:hypothetical protein
MGLLSISSHNSKERRKNSIDSINSVDTIVESPISSIQSIPSELSDLFGTDAFEKRIYKRRHSGPDIKLLLKTDNDSITPLISPVMKKRAKSMPLSPLKMDLT